VGDENLGHDGEDPDRGEGHEQNRSGPSPRDDEEGCRGEDRVGDDEPSAIDEVTERHQQQQAEAVAHLRHRGDGPDGSVADAELVGDAVEERLGEGDARDGEAAGRREQDAQHADRREPATSR